MPLILGVQPLAAWGGRLAFASITYGEDGR